MKKEKRSDMAKRINVLFLLPQLKPGGSETLVLNMVKQIDHKRFSPCIAWFHDEKSNPFYGIHEVPMFFLNKGEGFDVLVIFKLLKIIRDKNIDIINAHHFMPLFYSFFACKLSCHAKLVYTEHSVWEAERLVGFWKRVAQFILGLTDTIVGVSPEIMEYLINKYHIKKGKYVP